MGKNKMDDAAYKRAMEANIREAKRQEELARQRAKQHRCSRDHKLYR